MHERRLDNEGPRPRKTTPRLVPAPRDVKGRTPLRTRQPSSRRPPARARPSAPRPPTPLSRRPPPRGARALQRLASREPLVARQAPDLVEFGRHGDDLAVETGDLEGHRAEAGGERDHL